MQCGPTGASIGIFELLLAQALFFDVSLQLKVTLVGDEKVGKTSLLTRYHVSQTSA